MSLAFTVVFIIVRRFACLWSKMPMFQRAGMKEGGLPLPPTFQNLIFMTWRACDLNFVMISLMASKCQDFKLIGLQFHFIKQLKKGHPNFKALPFWGQWRYHDQICIASSSYHKNQIEKLVGVANFPSSLLPSGT